jgi:hypothetical protein
MRALTSLNLAENHLGKRRGKAKYGNSDPENYSHWQWHKDMSGIVAIADVLGDMGAMTSLNLASNCLCGIDEYGQGVYDASGTV